MKTIRTIPYYVFFFDEMHKILTKIIFLCTLLNNVIFYPKKAYIFNIDQSFISYNYEKQLKNHRVGFTKCNSRKP